MNTLKQFDLFSNEAPPKGLHLCSVTSSAFISECGQYRYELRRTWDESRPKVMFIMLNPSTADAEIDDPTIRRCVGFAKSWGYGGILVGNLFAYRATEPKTLLTVNDPIGRDNIEHIMELLKECEKVICAWGNGKLVERVFKKMNKEYKPFAENLKGLYYLELANDGTPKHPLYLKGHLKPVRFEVPACRVS